MGLYLSSNREIDMTMVMMMDAWGGWQLSDGIARRGGWLTGREAGGARQTQRANDGASMLCCITVYNVCMISIRVEYTTLSSRCTHEQLYNDTVWYMQSGVDVDINRSNIGSK